MGAKLFLAPKNNFYHILSFFDITCFSHNIHVNFCHLRPIFCHFFPRATCFKANDGNKITNVVALRLGRIPAIKNGARTIFKFPKPSEICPFLCLDTGAKWVLPPKIFHYVLSLSKTQKISGMGAKLCLAPKNNFYHISSFFDITCCSHNIHVNFCHLWPNFCHFFSTCHMFQSQ